MSRTHAAGVKVTGKVSLHTHPNGGTAPHATQAPRQPRLCVVALCCRRCCPVPLTTLAALSTAPGISASPSEENLRYFNVMILGPSQSPYEGAPHVLVVPQAAG